MSGDAYARYDLTVERSVDKDIRHYMADEIDDKDGRIAELEATLARRDLLIRPLLDFQHFAVTDEIAEWKKEVSDE